MIFEESFDIQLAMRHKTGETHIEFDGIFYPVCFMDPGMEPGIPKFVGYYAYPTPHCGMVLVSTVVPPKFYQFLVRYELRRMRMPAGTENRCLHSLVETLKEVPESYFNPHLAFLLIWFNHVAAFYKDKSSPLIDPYKIELTACTKYLEALARAEVPSLGA